MVEIGHYVEEKRNEDCGNEKMHDYQSMQHLLEFDMPKIDPLMERILKLLVKRIPSFNT